MTQKTQNATKYPKIVNYVYNLYQKRVWAWNKGEKGVVGMIWSDLMQHSGALMTNCMHVLQSCAEQLPNQEVMLKVKRLSGCVEGKPPQLSQVVKLLSLPGDSSLGVSETGELIRRNLKNCIMTLKKKSQTHCIFKFEKNLRLLWCLSSPSRVTAVSNCSDG